jgi:hypothetical protein
MAVDKSRRTVGSFRVGIFLLVTALAVALLAPPASAKGSPSDTDSRTGKTFKMEFRNPETAQVFSCSVYVADPTLYYTGGRIVGYASTRCSTGSGIYRVGIDLAIQQYRGLGYWSTKAHNATTAYGTYVNITLYWFCAAGTGSQLYRDRGQGTAYFTNGTTSRSPFYYSGQRRYTCPQ